MSSRNPFPSLTRENDFTLSGFRRAQRNTFDIPIPIAQQEEPWNRLHKTSTWASRRRSVMHYELQAPNDSLEFMLKAVYNPSNEFPGGRKQVVLQQQTISKGQKKQADLEKEHIVTNEHGIRVWVDPQRRSIYNVK